MKKIFLSLFFVHVFGLLFAQEASVIEPELLQALNGCGKNKVSVTIVMKEQTNSISQDIKVASHSSGKIARSSVVRGLKEFAGSSQGTIIAFLSEEEKKGNVANVSSLWIANTICCDAVADVIHELAIRDDVATIGLNKEVQMLCSSNDNFAQYAAGARASSFPHLIQVQAPAVWEQGYTGKNVVVAILDSGINDEHLDLKDHLWQGYADTDGDGEADDLIHGWNFSVKSGDGNSNIRDDYGHGTHCAGIICGDGTTGNITGVAPDATLMTLKTINRAGGGSPANMIKGVQFAIENGADIISISSGFKANQISTSDKEALRRTFVSALEAGVIAFVAAGNDGEKGDDAKYVDIPASCPPPYLHPDQQANSGGLSSVVCVGAVNADDAYASFSSQGPATWQDTEFGDYLYDETNENHFGLIRPDICAPGNLIYSLKHDENDKYKLNSGTSQATPCAAGIAALMLEKNSSLTPADICRIMETTAKKISDKKNNLTGAGRVDALNAVNAVEAGEDKPFVKVVSFPENIAHGNSREMCLTVVNRGKGVTSEEAKITLTTNDRYIEVPTNVISLGCLNSGETKEQSFSLNVNSAAPNGHTAYMTVTITDGNYSWNDEFALRINSFAQIVFNSEEPQIEIKGDEMILSVGVVNKGNVATTGKSKLVLELDTDLSDFTFTKKEDITGVIAPGENVTAEFAFKLGNNVPEDGKIDFDLFAIPNNYTDVKDLVYSFEQRIDDYGALDNGLEGWTTLDANGDKYNHPWWNSSLYIKHKMETETSGTSYSGKGHAISESYCSAIMVDYEKPIDNYLVSPKIKATENSRFSFKARAHVDYPGYHPQHFGVAVSESGNYDPLAFETIKEWDIVEQDGTGWINYSVDLSAYSGKEIYVAIRNFFSPEDWEWDTGYNAVALHVDDAEFDSVIDMSYSFKYDNYSYFSVNVNNVGGETVVEDLEAVTDISIQVVDGKVVIAGVAKGDIVGIYDMCGRNLCNRVVGGDDIVHLNSQILGKGVLVVKVLHGNEAFVRKVFLGVD